MNGNDLTEREKKILEEGNTKQIEQAKAARKEIECAAKESGRYPLWLAVEMMTDNLSDRAVLIDKLRSDACLGRLALYRSGRHMPEEYKLLPLVLKESDEYILDDLNIWLVEHAKQIQFRFPGPKADNDSEHLTDVDPDSLGTSGANEKHPPYLTTSALIGCFGSYMGVTNPTKVLSEYPNWATRSGALVRRGRRGKPSQIKPEISEWDPVQFALNLLDKKPLPRLDGLGDLKQQHLDTVFSMKDLAQWKPIWTKSKPL